MQIRELSNKVSSDSLNESLARNFGYRLKIDQFSESQLANAQLQLSEKITTFEKTSSFDSVLENADYQKTKLMLDVIRQAVQERTLSEPEKEKKEKYVKGMKKAKPEFEKRYGDKGDEVMYATATKMAKTENVGEAMQILRTVLSERTLLEGEEERAALIMSSRDMVDRITRWLEDVASMKAETMLELVDALRDELGSDVSQPFADTVKPALEELYVSLETTRTILSQAVSIITGEEGPAGAPPTGEPGMPGAAPEMNSELAAPEAPALPDAAGRVKRESIEYSRRLGTILSSKKK